MQTVQTDNGLEFQGVFDDYLKAKGIAHLFTYPRCPKINAYIERANRTLREEFVDWQQSLLLTSLPDFNHRLMEYLVWYNTKRVHQSLGNTSPLDHILQHHHLSQMTVTYTRA